MPVSQTRIRVRYAETDQMGVVYYANFFIWFEVGRVELLRQLGFHYKQMEIDDDCHIPVVEANCRYKSPARYDDELLLETRVLAIRRSVIKFGYRLLRPEGEASTATPLAARTTLLAEGETTHVIVDRSLRKVPLPEKYAAVLQQFMFPTPHPDSSGR
jgi:acyl-CoA thioester hydrolase